MKAGDKKNKEIELEGKVVLETFGKDSKSEHESVCLQTQKDLYKLRRMDGNPFHDPVLLKWIGKHIVANGILHDYLFIATELKEKETKPTVKKGTIKRKNKK